MIGSDELLSSVPKIYGMKMPEIDKLTISHDNGIFSGNCFVCNALSEIDGQEHGVLKVTWSVGCLEENF
jgi:hypothetical protein